MERTYHAADAKLLSGMNAPLDDAKFKRMYFAARDRWTALHHSGADMQQQSLLALLMLWDYAHPLQPEPAATKPGKQPQLAKA